MTARPVRLQLSRKAGFNLQAHSRAINGLDAVNVARPSKRGNPFDWMIFGREGAVDYFERWLSDKLSPQEREMLCFDLWDTEEIERTRILTSFDELRGKNLACFCKAGEPCHADVLLEIANR